MICDMKNYILILILGLFIFAACEKNERILYSKAESVYLSEYKDAADSLTVSLATKKIGTDTVYIKVKLLGRYLEKPAKFGLEVKDDMTDATEDVHYKPLQEYYIFPAGVPEYKMPVVLIKGDNALKKKSVTLAVKLKADELETAYIDKQYVRIIFSDMFLAPVGTDYYGNMTQFVKLFGVYSQKKHQMIFEYLGEDLPTKKYAMYYKNRDPEWRACSKALSDYCRDNNVIDENGNKILPWK